MTIKLPDSFYHVTPVSRYKPALSPNRMLRGGCGETCIASVGLEVQVDSSDVPAVYLSSSRSICEAYAENGHGIEEHDHWILLRVNPLQLDVHAFLGDYHQEYDSAWERLASMGYTEDQIDENEVPWWDVLHCTSQVRYTKNIALASITPVAAYVKWQWFDLTELKRSKYHLNFKTS
jgi:hypothetical protein